MIEAVDLFCGSGGLTRGLRQSGVKVFAGVDFEKECQYPYEQNNGAKFLNWDIGKTEAGDIAALFVFWLVVHRANRFQSTTTGLILHFPRNGGCCILSNGSLNGRCLKSS